MLFGLITVSLSLLVALSATEAVLRYQRQHIEQSDRLQQGMTRFDPKLGWRLSSNWVGSHQHYDFDVDYGTNRYGFRGEFPEPRGGKRYAVVGDSFTFGIGVENDQTFVHQLTAMTGGRDAFLNFSVPGFSTDQQFLLIRERIRLFEPQVILLVVYLGNDLFDNELAYPLQVDHAKPYFVLDSTGVLHLKNSPVPARKKPAAARGRSLAQVVLGEGGQFEPSLTTWLGELEIFRRLGFFQAEPNIFPDAFQDRFESAVRLFDVLVEKIRESSVTQGAELKIVLLGGKSYVDGLSVVSYEYQDYLRRRILELLDDDPLVEVIDLAALLRDYYSSGKRGLYYPNEGHLTPEGHRVVAEILTRRLN